jgi:hypothetical protein
MNTKLTLTIEQIVIEKAKRHAKGQGRSLSDMIENYLRAITKDDKPSSTEMSPVVKSLRGAFKSHEDLDYQKELSKILASKYSA